MDSSVEETFNQDINVRNMLAFYREELLGLTQGDIIIDSIPHGTRKRLIESGVLRKFGSKYEVTDTGLKLLLTQRD
jgi:hypothetical protein